MDFEKFYDLIVKEKFAEAEEYKNSCVPDTLYKYYYLGENECKNKQKIMTIQRGEIYLSPLKGFNDPFEGKSLFFQEGNQMQRGFYNNFLKKTFEGLGNNCHVACFSNVEEKYQSMPMWAYYANEHKGFCVEYEIQDDEKTHFFPVSYDQTRIEGTPIVANLMNNYLNLFAQGESDKHNFNKMHACNYMLHMSFIRKHISWQHENEYRILLDKEYFKLAPKKIYLGMNCSSEHEELFIKIMKDLPQCELFKMKNASNDSNFFLEIEQLK